MPAMRSSRNKAARKLSPNNLPAQPTLQFRAVPVGLDCSVIPDDNNCMNIAEKSLIPAELFAELEEALRNPYAPPNPEDMAKACKQMNRMREETKKKTGELNVAVDLVRDARK